DLALEPDGKRDFVIGIDQVVDLVLQLGDLGVQNLVFRCHSVAFLGDGLEGGKGGLMFSMGIPRAFQAASWFWASSRSPSTFFSSATAVSARFSASAACATAWSRSVLAVFSSWVVLSSLVWVSAASF